MEFANDGDLEGKIKEKRKSKSYFDEEDIWNVIIQALRGLNWLHDCDTLHRDLKVSLNILTNFNS